MQKTVYIETTIPSKYYELRPQFEYQKDATRDWWDNYRQNYILYSSEFVKIELNKGQHKFKAEILNLFLNTKGIQYLKFNNDIREIIEIYISNHLMPKEEFGDAYHLAVASYYKIDILLTWNIAHLANLNKLDHMERINYKLKLNTPRILTPESLTGI